MIIDHVYVFLLAMVPIYIIKRIVPLRFRVGVAPKGDQTINFVGQGYAYTEYLKHGIVDHRHPTVGQVLPVDFLALILLGIFIVVLIIKLRMVYLQHALTMTDTQDN